MMTSFGWKRKIGESVSKTAACKFKEVTGTKETDEDDEVEEGDALKWLEVAKKRKLLLLEDARAKSNRLKDEGTVLAEAERYWEAVKKWNEALQLTPQDYRLLEMKAQALMILHEVFPAVQTAEQAVQANPQWWVTYQTLGRAQMGLGEIDMAIKNFSKAIHVKPDEEELWTEDLHWACSLLQEKKQRNKSNTTCTMQSQEKMSSSSHSSKTSGKIKENIKCSSNDNDSGSTEDKISHRKENVQRQRVSSGSCVIEDSQMHDVQLVGPGSSIDGNDCDDTNTSKL